MNSKIKWIPKLNEFQTVHSTFHDDLLHESSMDWIGIILKSLAVFIQKMKKNRLRRKVDCVNAKTEKWLGILFRLVRQYKFETYRIFRRKNRRKNLFDVCVVQTHKLRRKFRLTRFSRVYTDRRKNISDENFVKMKISSSCINTAIHLCLWK